MCVPFRYLLLLWLTCSLAMAQDTLPFGDAPAADSLAAADTLPDAQPELRRVTPLSLWRYEVALAIGNPWKTAAGAELLLPFRTGDYKQLSIRKDFFLKEKPQDTLILYIGGLEGQAEIYLNDRIFALAEYPFKDYYIRIAPDLLNAQWNVLELRLSRNPTKLFKYYRTQAVGIHKEVLLLRQSTFFSAFDYHQAGFELTSADTAVFYPIYEQDDEPIKKAAEIEQDLSLIRKAGYKVVYAPFVPDEAFLHGLARQGLRLQLHPPDYLITFERVRGLALNEWRNVQVLNLTALGQAGKKKVIDRAPFRLNLTLLVAIPLLLLVVWKLVDGRSYQQHVSPAQIADLRFEYGKEIKSLFWGAVLYVTLLRTLLFSIFIIFLLSYIITNDWSGALTGPFFRRLEEQILLSRNSQIRAFADVLWIVMGYSVAKYLVLQFLGSVYQQSALPLRLMLLENKASFPQLFLVCFVGFVLLIVEGGAWWFAVWGLTIVFYLVRKYLGLYLGVKSTLRFPELIIFLYLCGVEWLPWLLVWKVNG